MLKVAVLLFSVSCLYQFFTTWCASRFARRRALRCPEDISFCQVKPVREPEESTLQALDSFWAQTASRAHDFYLCSSADGPRDWLGERPHFTWLKVEADQSRNGKAATLAQAQRYWSGALFLISDADMRCSGHYLDAVLGEFRDPEVGVVTCLYRGNSGSLGLGALFESLCILDFSSSVLVAERVEGVNFAMGSTMAIRRETLEQIGGFEALEPYLADDFQLGHRAGKRGWKVRLAPTVMETDLGAPSLRNALAHQYRWLVTSRVSRPGGHFAFIVTQGLVWAGLVALSSPALGGWLLALWSMVRIGCGSLQSWFLRPPESPKAPWSTLLLPLKDLLFLVLWARSCWGSEVRWGEQKIEVDSEGRILR